jgi:probable F420-dependent oxidoreductase
MDNARFGIFLPVFGGAYSDVQPQLNFEVVREIALIADRRGYDSIGIPDHLLNPLGSVPGREGMPATRAQGVLEAWTTLSALSTITYRVRLNNIVLCNLFRYPSLLAKMASTLDIISNGRLSLAIGAGWFRGECKAYGIPWKPYNTRLQMLRESIQLMKKLWTEQEVTFTGKHYRLDKATLNPKPIQKPHPPIIIGGSSEKVMKLAAEEADGWDVDTGACSFETFKQRVLALKDYCCEIGRDVDSIKISIMATPFLAENLSHAKKLATIWAERIGRNPEEYISSNSVWLGTAVDIISCAEKWFESGADVINFILPHNVEYVEKFTLEIGRVRR